MSLRMAKSTAKIFTQSAYVSKSIERTKAKLCCTRLYTTKSIIQIFIHDAILKDI